MVAVTVAIAGIQFARKFASDPRVRALIARARDDPAVRERFAKYGRALVTNGQASARRMLMNDMKHTAMPTMSNRLGATNFGAHY